MNRLSVLIAAAVFSFCAIFARSSFAAPENIPSAAGAKFDAAIARHQRSSPRIHDTLEAMKKAGASYLPELTASPGNLRTYQTPKSQRQMVGVYLFDMSYASAFDRKKQVKESGEALQQLLTTLGVSDQKLKQQYQKLVKESAESGSQTLALSFEKKLNESFRSVAATADGAALVTEAAYGWLIEGLYVTSEIVAQQNYSPKFLLLINQHAESIKPVVEMMETIRNNPNLAKSVAASERLTVLTALSAKLKGAQTIGKNEVDAVRSIVSKARAALIQTAVQ